MAVKELTHQTQSGSTQLPTLNYLQKPDNSLFHFYWKFLGIWHMTDWNLAVVIHPSEKQNLGQDPTQRVHRLAFLL